MINKIQILSVFAGLSMIAGAGALGFSYSNWIAAFVLGGIGASTFIFGTQHDR